MPVHYVKVICGSVLGLSLLNINSIKTAFIEHINYVLKAHWWPWSHSRERIQKAQIYDTFFYEQLKCHTSSEQSLNSLKLFFSPQCPRLHPVYFLPYSNWMAAIGNHICLYKHRSIPSSVRCPISLSCSSQCDPAILMLLGFRVFPKSWAANVLARLEGKSLEDKIAKLRESTMAKATRWRKHPQKILLSVPTLTHQKQ